jgi:predicted ATPase
VSSQLDPAAQHLVDAANHLRAADQDLRMVLTLLRQERRDVPETVEDTLACIADALAILDS